MTVSVEFASEHLPDLLSALDRGEQVEITREQKAAVVLAVREDDRSALLAEPPKATEE